MKTLDIVREKLEAILIYSAYAPAEVRRQAGISLLSQVWIDVPAWYSWLPGVPGAFMLEAVGADCWQHDGDTFDTGRFVVRFFPPADSPLLADFSAEEQSLRKSTVFDDTGTPKFEQLQPVRAGRFFECAMLECHFSRRAGDLIMLLRTAAGPTLRADAYDQALCLSLAGLSALYYRSAPKHFLISPADAPDTAMQAIVFPGRRAEHGQAALRHYLALDPGTEFIAQSDREAAWQRLATIEPEAMKSPDCCCCH